MVSITQEYTSENQDTWVTRTEFHYDYRVAYALISREVERGTISVKLDVDGKVKINLEEAKAAFGKNKTKLF